MSSKPEVGPNSPKSDTRVGKIFAEMPCVRTGNDPPAEPEAFPSLAPQRGLSATEDSPQRPAFDLICLALRFLTGYGHRHKLRRASSSKREHESNSRNCQTSTATPAKPEGLPLTLASSLHAASKSGVRDRSGSRPPRVCQAPQAGGLGSIDRRRGSSNSGDDERGGARIAERSIDRRRGSSNSGPRDSGSVPVRRGPAFRRSGSAGWFRWIPRAVVFRPRRRSPRRRRPDRCSA